MSVIFSFQVFISVMSWTGRLDSLVARPPLDLLWVYHIHLSFPAIPHSFLSTRIFFFTFLFFCIATATLKAAPLQITCHLLIPEQISLPCSAVITMHFHVKRPIPAAVGRGSVRLCTVIGTLIKRINVTFIAEQQSQLILASLAIHREELESIPEG